ncbi:MAG: aminotransferase class IV [Bacteroidia bacterium]|nr:aminotransferase class IV [Bacteroidia bacterium]
MDNYIIYNGLRVCADDVKIPLNNRSFRYGDGLFETILVLNKTCPLLKEHFDRLQKGLSFLKFSIPLNFTYQTILNNINQLLNIYSIDTFGKIRITIYRNGNGFYTPNDNSFSSLIEFYPLRENPLKNFKSIDAKLFSNHLKPCNKLGNYKTNNTLLYVLASIFKEEQQTNEAIILNEHHRICEATTSNLFIITSSDTIITPPLSEGCLDGVMRAYLLKNFLPIIEDPITVTQLLNAKECFLTNAVSGITSVKKIENTLYNNTITLSIIQALQQKISNIHEGN